MNKSPEFQFLIQEVSRQYGGRLETTTDFDALSDSIESRSGERISPSTLKRIWGYVRLNPRQRRSTLDILSRYAGRKDYRALCIELQETSNYFTEESLRTRDLVAGTRLSLCWMPDRKVRIRYLGEYAFEVEDPGTSKLRTGDKVHCAGFLIGQSLYLDIERDGETMPPYVAGRAKGLTAIQILDE